MSHRYPAALCLLLGGCYALLGGAALGGSLGLVVLASVLLYPLDYLLQRTDDQVVLGGLGRIGFSQPWRFVYRQILVLAFLLRSAELSGTAQVLVVLAVLGHHAAVALYNGLRLIVAKKRLRLVETRNLPVPGETLPPPPPDWLLASGMRVALHTELLLTAALAWALLGGSYAPVAPGAVLMVLAAAGVALGLLPQVLALSRLPRDELRMREAQRAVRELMPVVILHFSGDIDAVYQLNMWLETMQRLDRPVLVLLRERRYLDLLSPTSVPVLCLPFSIDLMNFEFPGARVALYVANVGKNIHLLRVPTLKSAFIGHGDSDKTASFNPFAKVYDEVWVAGEAGRQRYLRAQVGVRDEAIVLVGRPQLDGIEQGAPRTDTVFTVLYAPTWEGWTEDPHQSSLIPMGREIIRQLLESPGVRVIYKPHPLTGTVNPLAQRVSEEIVAALRAAGPQHIAVLDNAMTLYQCFDESDALVSDISSVVSDYLQSEKPYFVTNGAGLPDSAFRELNPSAGAAYLIGPDAEGLAAGLGHARGADELRSRRHDVRTYLLGDPAVPAMTLFRKAVDDLASKAAALQGVERHGVGDDDERRELQGEPEPLADALSAHDRAGAP